MRKIGYGLIIVLLLIIGMAMAGCKDKIEEYNSPTSWEDQFNDDLRNRPTPDTAKKNSVSDSIRILNDWITKIEENQASIRNELSEEINLQINAVGEKEGTHFLISWLTAAIAFILSFIALWQISNLKQKIEELNKTIEKLTRVGQKEDKGVAPPSYTSYSSRTYNPDYSKLDSRLSRLERELRKIQQSPQNTVPETEKKKYPPTLTKEPQTKYFASPSKKSETEAYFEVLSDTKDTSTRFKANVADEIAKFEPITGLGEITSSDSVNRAIEIIGCDRSEASRYSVRTPGEARLEDGYWVIKKKAIIKLER